MTNYCHIVYDQANYTTIGVINDNSNFDKSLIDCIYDYYFDILENKESIKVINDDGVYCFLDKKNQKINLIIEQTILY